MCRIRGTCQIYAEPRIIFLFFRFAPAHVIPSSHDGSLRDSDGAITSTRVMAYANGGSFGAEALALVETAKVCVCVLFCFSLVCVDRSFRDEDPN